MAASWSYKYRGSQKFLVLICGTFFGYETSVAMCISAPCCHWKPVCLKLRSWKTFCFDDTVEAGVSIYWSNLASSCWCRSQGPWIACRMLYHTTVLRKIASLVLLGTFPRERKNNAWWPAFGVNCAESTYSCWQWALKNLSHLKASP